MSYLVTYEVSEAVWKESLQQFPEANFLQSWEWGQFQLALGRKVFRFFVLNDGKVIGITQIVKEEAKRGTYFTIAGGPIFDWDNDQLFTVVFNEIKQLGGTEKVDFIRFRPQELHSQKRIKQVEKIGAQLAQMHLTADLTLQLDLTKSEDELLAEMRKNHRSAIRKSQKLGITIKSTKDPGSIQSFYDNQVALAQRHGFVPFSYEFLHEQFKAFIQSDSVMLFHAYDQDVLLSSAFIIFYNNEAVYHYGISTDENRKLPGSYACQWAAILEAKQRGCIKYNFLGNSSTRCKGTSVCGCYIV